MSTVKSCLAVAMVLAGISGMAQADNKNLYVAVQGGVADYPSGSLGAYYGVANTTPSKDYAGPNTGYMSRATVGLFINPSFAIEATGISIPRVYFTGSNAGGATVNITSRAFGSSLSLVSVNSGNQQGDYVSLLVKLGVSLIRSTSTLTCAGVVVACTQSPLGNGTQFGLTFGIGVQSEITQNLALRVDWDSYLPPSGSPDRFSTLLLGFSYKLF